MQKLTLMIIVLVATAALTLSGCGGGGSSSSGTPGTPPPVTDTDGDGVVDTLDAFPNEPIASVDDDGDGFPDQWHPNVTDADIADSGLSLDAFLGCSYAAVASATDPTKAAKDHPSTGTPEQLLTCGGLVASGPDDDDDGDGVLNGVDPAPLMGIADIPTEREAYGQLKGLASPFFDANPFEQQMIRFEEFGPEAMPTSAVEEANWIQLPQPQDYENGPRGEDGPDGEKGLNSFLAQDGVWPMPQRLSNVDIASPWKSTVREYISTKYGRDFIQPPAGVPVPAEGRPSGEDWAHQEWVELYPQKFFKTAVAQSRVNQGLRDSKQRHGYAKGEFGPDGLYHRVYTWNGGTPTLHGTTNGIAIKFHPNMPEQLPNSIWTFDGTLPPKLLVVRHGEPVLMRNYNVLPMDETATSGFGRHTISTHMHNGHQPGESDGYAGAFFYPGQFYDYRWPLQLAGYSNNNNAAGAINFHASEPRAAIPCDEGETFSVLVNDVNVDRECGKNGQPVGGVMIPGDWRETMSTQWFHDHMLDHTSENVYKGNATVVNYFSAIDRGYEGPGFEYNLRFPSGTALSWGNRDYDINLVIADKAFKNAPGTEEHGQLWMNTLQRNGFLGDVMTVNFLYKPYFDVRARKYRFRILNGSVSRIMAIGLVQRVEGTIPEGDTEAMPGNPDENINWQPHYYKRVPFHMIGNDGNIMEHAVAFDGSNDYGWGLTKAEWKGLLPSQTIAERYDIIVDFSQFAPTENNPEPKLYLVNVMEHKDGKGTERKVPMADILSGKYQASVKQDTGQWINGDPGVGKILELRVHAMAEGQVDLSMNPADYEPGKKKMIPLTIDRVAGTVTNPDGKVTANLLNARHHTFEYVRSNANGGHGTPWAIKVDGGTDERADVRRISAIETGDPVIYTIKTGGGWTHPVHIHFEEGVILTRDGKTPPEWEKWARKDMYRIGPEGDSGLKLEIAFRARDFLGHYVQHCHNTMHEDHAMLLRWDGRKTRAERIDTPMPMYDGVFFEPSFETDKGLEGDGYGPKMALD